MNRYEEYTHSIEKCLVSLKQLKYDEYINPNSEEYISFYRNLINAQNKLSKASYLIRNELPGVFDNEVVAGEEIFCLKCENNIFIATFNNLMEKRYRLNSAKDNYAAYVETVNYFHSSYWLSLMKSDVQVKRFDELAVVFRHHYKKKSRIKDLDNFEYKNFIDTVLVQGGFINDDNPERLKTIYTSLVEETSGKSYTEVIWGEPHVISKLLLEERGLEF